MLVKAIATGLAGSVLLGSVAFAQTPMANPDKASTTQAAASPSSFQGDWRAAKLVGLNVYNENNESIGSISDLLMDKSGSIKAAVISAGGVLGVGARLVAVPYDKVKFVNEPIAYTGVSGGPNTAPPATGPASSTTTGSAANPPATPPASKPNPWYPDHAVFNATKDELKAMPEFTYTTE